MAAQNQYVYQLNAFPHRAYNENRLRDEVRTVAGISKRLTSLLRSSTVRGALVFTFERELSAPEKILLDGVVAAHQDDDHHLPSLKQERFIRIDSKTRLLISKGFLFGGKRFSLSDNAQKTLLGLEALADNPNMQYPVLYNALNDADGSISLNNATDIHAFFLTAMAAFRQAWDSGTALKEAVRQASTIEAVHAIVDDRS